MVWAILAFLGVPLWLCAIGILMVVSRNRSLRKRGGDIPVRVRPLGKKRWIQGHAIWISDVFAWRGSPAAWNEAIVQISGAKLRPADAEERKKLRRLGDAPAVASLSLMDGGSIDVATRREHAAYLIRPFADVPGGVGSPSRTP